MSRPCDFCQECRAGLYCRADDAFLCLECDTKVHKANKLASRHERVWLCEVCEVAPAVVLCKADSASLCLRCDHEVHSANPFAERHERHPVVPFVDTPISTSPSSNPFPATATATAVAPQPPAPVPAPAPAPPLDPDTADDDTSAAEAASWILPVEAGAIQSSLIADPTPYTLAPSAIKTETPAPLFYPPPETASSEGGPKSPYPDFLLPRCIDLLDNNNNKQRRDTATSSRRDGDFVVPSGDAAAFTQTPIKVTPSLSRSVSLSSLDARVVPDSMSSEISTPLLQLGSSNRGGGDPPPPNVTGYEPMDPKAREARVLRYREKRKNRKFERTIRYASRKVYADTRPRIKGRFAKKDNNLADVLQPFGQDEPVYGVVPAS